MKRSLLICLSVALVLRLAFVFVGFPYLQPRMHLREDGDGYVQIAESIRAGQYRDITRGPAYPLFVALAGSPLTVKVIQAILDTATCAGVWWLALMIGGGSASLCLSPLAAAWLWAVYPFAIWRAGFVNKEVLATFLLTSYMCVQVAALRHDRMGLWPLAGVLLGLINLCRPTFLLWPVIAVGIVALNRRGIVRPLAMTAAMVAVIAPCTVRNYLVTGGRFVPVALEQGGWSTFVGNYQPSDGMWEGSGRPFWESAVEKIRQEHPGMSAVELNSAFYRAAWEHIRAQPVRAAELVMRKCGRFWFFSTARRVPVASTTVQVLYLGLAGWGLWWGWRRGVGQLELALLVMLPVYLMGVHALSYADMRYNLPVMPCVCALTAAGCGIQQLEHRTLNIRHLTPKQATPTTPGKAESFGIPC